MPDAESATFAPPSESTQPSAPTSSLDKTPDLVLNGPIAALAPAPAPEVAIVRTPGRFETDADLGMHPKLYDAPQKRREFVVYVPRGWSKEARAPLIVLCHGCKQTPEEFARGTRIAELADRLGCLVLMPRQTKWVNPWRCWNWYDPSAISGGGEAAIVAAQVRFIRKRYRADPRRIAVIGFSAGAALAAVLGMRYPRHVRAVITHAGVACGAASSAITASDVMLRGPNTDVEAIATQARAKYGGAPCVPLLAIHGESDVVVSPVNSIALIRQYLHFNGHVAVSEDAAAPGELPSADASVTVCTADNRDVTTREWRIDDRLVVRYVTISGLGHAWSGGDDGLAFNDAHAPDASQLVGEFLHEALP